MTEVNLVNGLLVAIYPTFYEICLNIKQDNWTVVRDPEGRIGPYAYHEKDWVSYDDVEDIRRKAEYIREKNLGGGIISALDGDDYNGICGCGNYPLLTALNEVLRNFGNPRPDNCT